MDWILIANLVMVILTFWLAWTTSSSVTQSQEQFVRLNRPYVVFQSENSNTSQLITILDQDARVFLKNIGKTAAEEVKVSAYYLDSNNHRNNLINEAENLEVGILYPDEKRSIVMLNPYEFSGTMKDANFTFVIEYKYLDDCISYNQTFTIINSEQTRRHAPMESSCNK